MAAHNNYGILPAQQIVLTNQQNFQWNQGVCITFITSSLLISHSLEQCTDQHITYNRHCGLAPLKFETWQAWELTQFSWYSQLYLKMVISIKFHFPRTSAAKVQSSMRSLCCYVALPAKQPSPRLLPTTHPVVQQLSIILAHPEVVLTTPMRMRSKRLATKPHVLLDQWYYGGLGLSSDACHNGVMFWSEVRNRSRQLHKKVTLHAIFSHHAQQL